MRSRRGSASEAGMTLVEVLVALAILGLAIAGIASSLGGASIASANHRRTVTADTVVRDYAEAIKHYVDTGHYVDCAGAGTYRDTTVGFATPPGFNVTQAQAVYQDLSGALNVVLVMDISSSIAVSNAVTQAKNAAKAFLSPLQGTGARVALVSFGTSASVERAPTTNVSAVMAEVDTLPFGGYGGNPPQYTNWEYGLWQAKSLFTQFPGGTKPLVVVVTDGNPNRWISGNPGSVQGSGVASNPAAVQEAKTQADAIKAAGSQIFAVGVGTPPDLDTANLQQISGPIQYGPGVEFEDADWMQGSNYSAVQSTLATIAADLAFEGFVSSCPTPDQGAQTLRLTASSVDGKDTETLDIIVRRP